MNHCFSLTSAHSLQAEFLSGKPFPSIVIDDFLPSSIANRISEEYPSNNEFRRLARHINIREEKKLGIYNPPSEFFAEVYKMFVSNGFVEFLGVLTNKTGLRSDKSTRGGGLHSVEKGGFLKIHVDANIHSRSKRKRELNFLYYLNHNWKSEWNGALEFWNKDMTEIVQKIEPVFNRAVIFETSSTSFHGHPKPLDPPDGVVRKAMAFYYYGDRAPECMVKHPTIYQDRPQDTIDKGG